jgi:hypothetical protein
MMTRAYESDFHARSAYIGAIDRLEFQIRLLNVIFFTMTKAIGASRQLYVKANCGFESWAL